MRFFYPIIVFLALLFAGISWWMIESEVIMDGNWAYGAVSLYFLVSIINSLLIKVSMTGKAKTFLYGVAGTSALRFFLSILFIVSYLIINEERDVPFVILFMVMYFFFTLFEIIHLVAKLRSEKNSSIEVSND